MHQPQNDNQLVAKQPAPTGMMAWVGFGCGLMALASLCISFVSPYWIQTWPLSENQFKNMGLWHVCFYNYMQFKDDSQEIYSGCWWVFDTQPKYYKLREWLTPPWFITCQVLVVGCLIILIATCIIIALVFLHLCPLINHEYLQSYGIFSAASLMILVSLVTVVVALIFGIQTNDRYWLPRPDLNFLSWGFGFLIITGIFSLAAGICLYKEAQNTYNLLLVKEDEYTKAALEMSTYQLEPSEPPVYDQEQYPYAPSASVTAHDLPPSYAPYGTGYGQQPYGMGTSFGQQSFAADPKKPDLSKSFAGKSFQAQGDDGDDFV